MCFHSCFEWPCPSMCEWGARVADIMEPIIINVQPTDTHIIDGQLFSLCKQVLTVTRYSRIFT